jgi:hypothetical protein
MGVSKTEAVIAPGLEIAREQTPSGRRAFGPVSNMHFPAPRSGVTRKPVPPPESQIPLPTRSEFERSSFSDFPHFVVHELNLDAWVESFAVELDRVLAVNHPVATYIGGRRLEELSRGFQNNNFSPN